MSDTSVGAAIDAIRAARDAQLEGLGVAIDRVRQEIARYSRNDAYLDRLVTRRTTLTNEMAAVRAAATDEVLALPGVIDAAGRLGALGKQMQDRAAEMPRAKDLLTKASQILTIAQKFIDLVASIQKA
jgi:hypothetical protein